MKAEHKAIIEAAEKEGLSPCEKDARLVVHDMVNATRAAMRKYEVGFNKMTEKQQDAVLADLENAYQDLALTVARTIASGSTPSVPATLKDLKISNGTLTAIVSGDEKYFNELISKVQDKSEVIIVLYERQYTDAMDAIQADKDQRSLPLDESPAKGAGKKKEAERKAPAAKPVELTEKILSDAREFVQNQQTVTAAGLQNILRVGQQKVEAVLAKLIEDGFIESKEHEGGGTVEYRLAKPKGQEPAGAESADSSPEAFIDAGLELGAESDDLLTDDLYADVKAHVISTKKVSAGGLSIKFNVSDDVIEQAIQRLELEGVITEENEAGMRSVVTE